MIRSWCQAPSKCPHGAKEHKLVVKAFPLYQGFRSYVCVYVFYTGYPIKFVLFILSTSPFSSGHLHTLNMKVLLHWNHFPPLNMQTKQGFFLESFVCHDSATTTTNAHIYIIYPYFNKQNKTQCIFSVWIKNVW